MSSALLLKKELRFNALHDLVRSGGTKSEAWRREQLQRIGNILEEYENEILKALKADLGKPENEAIIEIIALKQELTLATKKLREWIKPKRIDVPIALQPGQAQIQLEPLGCVLIIGPWNYPFSLTIQPLISALAAGNTAVLKPSEHSHYTSELIEKIFTEKFPKEIVQVCQGSGDVASELIHHSFDHIFFTGGSAIGQKVLEGAAKKLIPVTLELGGKSPALILEGADLDVTARRILWGKSLNAGQTCLAPNHLIIHEKVKDLFLKKLRKELFNFYGQNPLNSPDLAQIINKNHFSRLIKLIEQARNNKQILFGGDVNAESNLITPTICNVSSEDDPLLAEELFGPVLPILTFSSFPEIINQIQEDPSPLAIYMFGGTSEEKELLIRKTRSGGICFNDVIMQAGIPNMPFGGVGLSGMGRYHGFSGFETFSNKRAILRRPFFLDFKLRYPPYKLDISILKKLLG